MSTCGYVRYGDSESECSTIASVMFACGSRLAATGTSPTIARTRRSNSPSMSGKRSATPAPCRSRYTPSSAPSSNAADSPAPINAATRSNASSCTGPAGLAKHQVSGTNTCPSASATSIAPRNPHDAPRITGSSAGPDVSGGNPPGRRKSA